jgi:hypothetical protein
MNQNNRFNLRENIMKISKCLAALMALVFVSTSPAAFAGYECTGPVQGVSVFLANGDLVAEKVGLVSWPRLCNLRVTANAIPPEMCKIMYTALLTAQASGKTVTLFVNNNTATCATLAGWVYIADLYLIRVDG